MSRRIELELTSRRDDGTWTWRAAGARQPKGELDGSLLPEGSSVGDVLRAEAEFDIDGIVITSVLPPKGPREPKAPTIEVVGSRRDEGGVTTEWVERKERPRRKGGRDRDREGGGRDREGGRDRGDRRGGGAPRTGERPPRGERPRGERGPRPDRPAKPPLPPKPKPKRLRPGRVHRSAVLAELSEEQKPIAEQVLRGGIPAVRQAIDKQNAERKASGEPEIRADELVALAEQLLPRLRTAEWRDKAEAAVAEADEIDLRDLRSVVVGADVAARDDETRALAQQLREALAARVEREHNEWLKEISDLLGDGRVVRALRVSSRPPKAGTPLPPELATRLVEGASASLTADTPADRYATVLDALAFSPVRTQVEPEGVPETPSDALLAAVRKAGSRLPQIAARFGVTPAPRPPRTGRRPGPPPPPPPAPPAGAAGAGPAREVAAESPTNGATPVAAEPEASAAVEGPPPSAGDAGQDVAPESAAPESAAPESAAQESAVAESAPAEETAASDSAPAEETAASESAPDTGSPTAGADTA